jgi:hypothetical protein
MTNNSLIAYYYILAAKTFAMEIYQFFKTDTHAKKNQLLVKFILLSEEAAVNGIKTPKVRAWYYNKDDKYLGTDSLVEE